MKKIQGEYGYTYEQIIGDLTRAINGNNIFYNMVRDEILNIMNDEPKSKTNIKVNIDTFKFLK